MVRNFRGQVKVADVKAEFDALIAKINAVVDQYNEALDYDEEGVDYNIGSPEIAPVGYSLSIGALKKILGAYKGRVVGCNLYKKSSGSSNEYIVSNGLYITEDEETHLPKVMKLPTRDIYGDGDELWYSTEDDVYTLTGTYTYENVQVHQITPYSSSTTFDFVFVEGEMALASNSGGIYYCSNFKSEDARWIKVSSHYCYDFNKCNGLYVCGSDDGLLYSSNGYNWSLAPHNDWIRGAAEFNGEIYALGDNSSASAVYKLDISTGEYTEVVKNLTRGYCIKNLNGKLMVGSSYKIYVSDDGFATRQEFSTGVYHPLSATYGDGMYLFVGYNWNGATIYQGGYTYSKDLTQGFTSRSLSNSDRFYNVAYGKGKFLISGYDYEYSHETLLYKFDLNGNLTKMTLPTDIPSPSGDVLVAFDNNKYYLVSRDQIRSSRNGDTFTKGTPVVIEADLFIRKLNTNRDIPLCDSCFFESNNTPNYHIYTGAYPNYLGNNYTTPVSNKSGGIFVGVCESDRDGDYGAARLFGTEVFYERQGGKRDKRTWSIPAYLWLPKGAPQPYSGYGSEGIAFAKADAIWAQDDW